MTIRTPWGPFALVGDENGWVSCRPGRDDGAWGPAGTQLLEYLEGRRTHFDLPFAPTGTRFQQAVWDLLRAIPYGSTTTYAALARQLRSSPRAVGGAVGRNPLAILIPCHRVVGSDGKLTGFAYGLDMKRDLLALEGQ
ncbi:MAG TPA: methylated-DNA--[protein]-cysteine S-methyltransferase [Candidatus Xenobia bacterium]